MAGGIDVKLEAMQLKMVAVEGKVDILQSSLTDLVALFRADHDENVKLATRFEAACGEIERIREARENAGGVDVENTKKFVKNESDIGTLRKDVDKIKEEKKDDDKTLSSRTWGIITILISFGLSILTALAVWKIKGDAK